MHDVEGLPPTLQRSAARIGLTSRSGDPIVRLPSWDGPGRLWSLYDLMKHFRADLLAQRVGRFSELVETFRQASSRDEDASSQNALRAAFSAECLEAEGNFIGAELPEAAARLARIRKQLEKPVHPAALEVLAKNAADAIIHELSSRKFVRVFMDRRRYLDRNDLFGPRVWSAFPDARDEIKSAGNCLALECSTAAVFHLMRAAEFGLRALAYDRRIKIPKNTPIELATWEDVIRQLENAESAILNYPKTLAREAQFNFYHGALMQFRAFKNVFRNQIMHTRKSYDRHRALSVYEQVRGFMETLAERISDGQRTPVIWKGKKWLTKS